ncbi:MAG: DUF1080 domain-containing protein [Defluviitaleaceae bacterium]|nr:DUF1080 domain-containing protein [Defluviitaleaceae bacterium]
MKLMGKEIDIANSRIIFEDCFTDPDITKNWEIGRGEWCVNNGWLEGHYPKSGGGLIYSKQHFNCNVLMDFEAATIPPSNHDLNFTWCAEGWDAKTDNAGIGYIAGLGGWYENKTGIERAPEYKICAMTGAFKLEAGRTYHIQAGSIDGHCFLFIDGKQVLEVYDPNPIDTAKYGRVGLGVYGSHARFCNLKVCEICWGVLSQSY